ncbi:hypothetical protein CHUAL_013099 [Chamberlinius hualienensis]
MVGVSQDRKRRKSSKIRATQGKTLLNLTGLRWRRLSCRKERIKRRSKGVVDVDVMEKNRARKLFLIVVCGSTDICVRLFGIQCCFCLNKHRTAAVVHRQTL